MEPCGKWSPLEKVWPWGGMTLRAARAEAIGRRRWDSRMKLGVGGVSGMADVGLFWERRGEGSTCLDA